MAATEFNSAFNASGRHFGNETTQLSTSQLGCDFGHDAMSTQVARVFAYCVIITISTFGNSMTITVVCRNKHDMRKAAFNFLIVNLAATDLTITLAYMPRVIVMWLRGSRWLVEGVFGSVLCKIVPFLHGVSILVSILTLLALAIDRFLAIVYPFRPKITVKSSKFIIAFIWLLAVVVRFPYLYSLKVAFKEARGEFVCGANIETAFGNRQAREIYYTFLFIAFYGLPFIVIVMSYSVIVITLRRHKPLSDSSASARIQERESCDKASKQVFYMLLSVTAAFVFCWLTYFIAQIVFDPIPCSLRFWRLFLAHINSALNPCLYAVFNQKFRQGYKRLLCFLC